eukprot:7121523-Prorocentrum_lima.AAC.1
MLEVLEDSCNASAPFVVAEKALPRRLLLHHVMWRGSPGHSPTHALYVQDCRALMGPQTNPSATLL